MRGRREAEEREWKTAKHEADSRIRSHPEPLNKKQGKDLASTVVLCSESPDSGTHTGGERDSNEIFVRDLVELSVDTYRESLI